MNQPTINQRKMNLILLGPPGAGKSTIAESLVHDYDLLPISTGQRLRDEMEARSPLGRMITPYMDSGNLVPDSIMDRLLRATLDSLDPERGFLLDGYPRTMRQAIGLIGLFADYERDLRAVIALEVGDDEVVRRLSGRRICEGAGESFPIHIDDLASMLRCRERGGRPMQRDDDTPEIVRQRLQVYHEQTAPLLAFYEQSDVLCPIDATGSPAEVTRRVMARLKAER